MSTSHKPLLCLDFDGVLHSYTSGWQGAEVVSDPPVPGAMEALADYTERFRVAIHSSRSGQPGGIEAMQKWLYRHLVEWDAGLMQAVMGRVEWPTSKPPAFVTIDDRALTFTGTWPTPDEVAAFQPWNKRPPVDDELVQALVDTISAATGGQWPSHSDARDMPAILLEHGYRIVRA